MKKILHTKAHRGSAGCAQEAQFLKDNDAISAAIVAFIIYTLTLGKIRVHSRFKI